MSDQKQSSPRPNDWLSIGQLAQRTGLSVSAIRYYHSQELVYASRNAGGQRRFHRSTIRRLSFVLIAQQMGLPLEAINQQLKALPKERTPTAKDWASIGKRLRKDLDQRIKALTRMRDNLGGCIGCGCLSLKRCALYNPGDKAAAMGAGPNYLLRERASDP